MTSPKNAAPWCRPATARPKSTYNFPQGRVTDHRINFTTHNLPAVLGGDLDEILFALSSTENAERLKAAEF